MRPSHELPCSVCSHPTRKPNSTKCYNCHNEAQRAVWRAQKNGTYVGKQRTKRNTIQAFLAVEDHLRITASTIVQCYYSRPFRVCIFAHRRTDAMKWLKARTGMVKEDFMIASVCSIAQIDVNLTDIDLSQYGWQAKQIIIRHKEVAA